MNWERTVKHAALVIGFTVTAIACVSQPTPTADQPTTLEPQATSNGKKFNYAEALQKSILFFDANRSGKVGDNRFEWRGDATLNDGKDVGKDLTGGYYDAGDHIFFTQPMGMTLATLAWAIVDYRKSFSDTGQLDDALRALRYGTDWVLKAHVTDSNGTKEFYVQVGEGKEDHDYWGPPETIPSTQKRRAFKIDRTNGGTEIAAGMAAALSASYLAIKDTDTAYANKLLTAARQLYTFGETYQKKYSDSVPAAACCYTSYSGFNDELIWGAIWLYRATNESSYLTKAENYWGDRNLSDWSFATDDVSYGAGVLLARYGSKPLYKKTVEDYLGYWYNGTSNIKKTSDGYRWRSEWASSALAVSAAFMASVYNDTVKGSSPDQRWYDLAATQVNYLLGDNSPGQSYVVGFGSKYPKRSHHRASTGYDSNGKIIEQGSTANNQNIIYGYLVGGPKSANDYDYSDSRVSYQTNEGGTSMNAPLVGALAAMYKRFGGTPLTNAQMDALPGVRNYNSGPNPPPPPSPPPSNGWVFTPSSNINNKWAEVKVTAPSGRTYSKVEAIVNNANWYTLLKKDWGAYADSINIAAASSVVFRAWDDLGKSHDSVAYKWPSTSGKDAAWTFTVPLDVVNNFWLQTAVTPPSGKTISKVEGIVNGEKWFTMTSNNGKDYSVNTGSVSPAYEVKTNATVVFRAWDQNGTLHDSPVQFWK
jgi:endoglucanase